MSEETSDNNGENTEKSTCCSAKKSCCCTSFIKKIWKFLWTPSGCFSLATLLITGFIGAILFVVGGSMFLDHSSTTEFCVSCHEMETPYEQYKETIHYSNRTGVQAQCRDCHNPKAFIPKMKAKVRALNDIYGNMIGIIDTPEKFEKHKLTMAKSVWKRMKENDSRECRSCHNYSAMDYDAQGKQASRRHATIVEKGKTCIDCHKGIAHELPDDMEDEDF